MNKWDIFVARTMRIDSDVRRIVVEIKVDGTRGDSSIVRKAPGEAAQCVYPTVNQLLQSPGSYAESTVSQTSNVVIPDRYPLHPLIENVKSPIR